jgi:hypothetical protein
MEGRLHQERTRQDLDRSSHATTGRKVVDSGCLVFSVQLAHKQQQQQKKNNNRTKPRNLAQGLLGVFGGTGFMKDAPFFFSLLHSHTCLRVGSIYLFNVIIYLLSFRFTRFLVPLANRLMLPEFSKPTKVLSDLN